MRHIWVNVWMVCHVSEKGYTALLAESTHVWSTHVCLHARKTYVFMHVLWKHDMVMIEVHAWSKKTNLRVDCWTLKRRVICRAKHQSTCHERHQHTSISTLGWEGRPAGDMHICVYAYTRTYVHKLVYVRMCVYMYTRIYMHMHTMLFTQVRSSIGFYAGMGQTQGDRPIIHTVHKRRHAHTYTHKLLALWRARHTHNMHSCLHANFSDFVPPHFGQVLFWFCVLKSHIWVVSMLTDVFFQRCRWNDFLQMGFSNKHATPRTVAWA